MRIVERRFEAAATALMSIALQECSMHTPLYYLEVPEGVPYDLFVINNNSIISEGLRRNWTIVAEEAKKVLFSVVKDLRVDIENLSTGKVDLIVQRSLFSEYDLPVTPRRHTRSVHSAKAPRHRYVADYVLHAIGKQLGAHRGFVQNNINYVTQYGVVEPLYAHIDRGTKITMLACIRSSVPQKTLFISWSSFLGESYAPGMFLDSEGDDVFDWSDGVPKLSTAMIDRQYNWDQIMNIILVSKPALAESISGFNAVVDKDCLSDRVAGIDLKAGDVIIFDNKRLIHGRERADIDIKVGTGCGKNANEDERWLRALFI